MQFELTLNQPSQPPLGAMSSPLLLTDSPLGRRASNLGPTSEITLSGTARLCLPLLAPILRELNENGDGRWLTLIEPPLNLLPNWLREAGLNLDSIMLLRPAPDQSALDMACQLLNLGNSHTVVTWIDPLPVKARRQLAAAAESGQGQSLNIRIGI